MKKDKYQVWYCAKFDEIHLICRFHWNKYIAATYIDKLGYIDISWPRPNRDNNWIYIGSFD